MKTKNRNFLISAVLIGIAMLMTACVAERDNAAWNNPLGVKIYGLWYADYQESGIVGNDTPYSRVLQAVKFNADGTGMWWKFMFKADDASNPVDLYGGNYSGTFDYSVAADGTIRAERRGEATDGPMALEFHYQDGAITFGDGGAAQTMKTAPENYDNLLLTLENSMKGGAAADDYNINDKDITAENWRQTEAIYIYDGVSTDVTDEKGRTGYTTVNMPWYNGAVVSNLPMDFCDDITPENGWEWVLNFCGRRSMPNGNFFAVYNKYLGTLRFFFFMPQSYSAGNDHLWQVTLTQGLSDRYDARYGVPMDKTLSDKTGFGMSKDGSAWADYVTPYVSTMSTDGFITPNGGWWAFDVDLSLYRNDNIDLSSEQIRLQMRSWEKNNASLYSAIKADTEGDIDIDYTRTYVQKSKGLFGKISDVIKTGTSLAKTCTSLYSGDIKGGITNGIALGKNAINLKSTLTQNGSNVVTENLGNLSGTIGLTTNGTADTDGIIGGSRPTVGVVSPTFHPANEFNKCTGFGEGLWNIKSTPKMYYINKPITSYYSDFYKDDEPYWKESRAGKKWLADNSYWTFFDPSSVEVVLNPNVFPEDQIEWMQVDAIAGVRKDIERTGTDPARVSLGLTPLSESFNGDQLITSYYCGNDVNDYIFNFVGTGDFEGETFGNTFPKRFEYGKTGFRVAEEYWNYDVSQSIFCFGAGTDDYIIEPQMSCWRDGTLNWEIEDGSYRQINIMVGDGKTPWMNLWEIPFYLPPTEINVTLTVKLKNLISPLVFNRVYLPEFEYAKLWTYDGAKCDEAKVYEILDRILAKKNLSPKTAGHTQSYDFQAARINKCFKLLFGYSR